MHKLHYRPHHILVLATQFTHNVGDTNNTAPLGTSSASEPWNTIIHQYTQLTGSWKLPLCSLIFYPTILTLQSCISIFQSDKSKDQRNTFWSLYSGYVGSPTSGQGESLYTGKAPCVWWHIIDFVQVPYIENNWEIIQGCWSFGKASVAGSTLLLSPITWNPLMG